MKTILSSVVALMFLAVSVSAATIKILPEFGPTPGSPTFEAHALNSVNAIKTTGTLPRLLHNVTPENLITWTSNGVGTVIWWVELTAGDGETVALSDITATLSSSESNNILGKTVSFVGSAYTATAIGIRADGESDITSGPANQEAKRVIVGILSKSFPVSSPNEDLGVRNYLNQFPNWRITSVINAKGASASLSLVKGPPSLRWALASGKFLVIADNNGDPMNYPLQASVTVGSSTWTNAGTIRAGQTRDFGPVVAAPSLYVRYAP